jgi:4-hydroxy-tetrahydrodipicolinate synthase
MLLSTHLCGTLIPAVPVPFRGPGDIDEQAQVRYARWMAEQPVGGVAVWAHTGRGLHLDEVQRAGVLECWRKEIAAPQFVIAAAGSATHLAEFNQVIFSARSMARQATMLGADAVLVHPPATFRNRPDRDQLILEYHTAIAEAGTPLILFYLYEEAGGISYSTDLLRKLLAMPEVLGIKVATLDSIMTFQDLADMMQRHVPDKVLITGEDRFLGYSLMCGAQAALVGMGAACTALQAELLAAHRSGSSDVFLERSRAVDDLARSTFRAPMQGYIQRMLWCLVHQGVLPIESACDPYGPQLDPAEFTAIGECLSRIGQGGSRRPETRP